MKFVRFEIRNFKGIKFAALDLVPSGTNVFTLIGLNESGKTTILEALDDFGASREGMEALYGAKRVAEFVTYVPKHMKANFTGDIVTTAQVKFEDGEINEVVDLVERQTGCRLDPGSVPTQFRITRGYKFENSDYKSKIYLWSVSLRGRSKGIEKRSRARFRTRWERHLWRLSTLESQRLSTFQRSSSRSHRRLF